MKPQPDPASILAALNRCVAAMGEKGQPQALFAALDRELAGVVGHKLFTIMVLDYGRGVAERIYSNQPESYPVQGQKPLGDLTEWGRHVFEDRKPYIGDTRDDIRRVFFDHELIEQLGCGSVINLTIHYDGVILGTLNLLHEEHFYAEADIANGMPFAQLAAVACRDWANALGDG